MFSIFAKKIKPSDLVEGFITKLFPAPPGDNTLLLDVRARLRQSMVGIRDEPLFWQQVLNAALLSRWELAYYDQNLKVKSSKVERQMQEALTFVDQLLQQIFLEMQKRCPAEVAGWIMPRGVPVEQSNLALGPLTGKLKIVAALGRETPLPAV
jgi:hypothetical protein